MGALPGSGTQPIRKESQTTTIAIVIVALILLVGAGYLLFFQGKGAGKEVTLPDGLKYVEIAEGTGPTPTRGQTLSVLYTGSLQNGTVFDSSEKHGGKPYEFALGTGNAIQGWHEGLA